MGSLSSILRRLRAMPRDTLTKKLANIVREPHLLKQEYDGAFPNARDMTREVHLPNRKRKDDLWYSYQAGMYDQETPETDAIWHDAEVGTENVLRLLQALKKRGVKGMPPRGKR